jgi:hypothetical protein
VLQVFVTSHAGSKRMFSGFLKNLVIALARSLSSLSFQCESPFVLYYSGYFELKEGRDT